MFNSSILTSPRRVLRELPPRNPFASNVSFNLSPTPISPEEEIIQLRSRLRNLPVVDDKTESGPTVKSPRKCYRTPTKILSPLKCPTTPVRSSTRKRLELDSSYEESPDFNSKVKKFRLEIPQPSSSVEINLTGLSQPQLVKMICDLMASHPNLKKEIEKSMPEPDLKPLEERLNELRKNVFKAFPKKCWGSTKDSFCFTRVRTHLEAFKKDCVSQGLKLVESQQWSTALEYVMIAWSYVKSLPDWEDPAHNTLKGVCYRHLAAQCMSVLKKHSMNEQELLDLVFRLKALTEDTSTITPCLMKAQQLLDKLTQES